ncbi:MAG TPA: hypothetical protein VGL77_00815 [Armatimonadota bacterium]|jgi:hypothetical protein
MTRGLFALLVVCTLWLSSLALAQEQTSCQLQGIKVEPVANGLRLRLKADGLIDFSCTPDNIRWGGNTQLAIALTNMRGGADSLVEVGHYPLSHLEFSLLPGSENGIGLQCRLVFYGEARVSVFNGAPYGWDDTSWAPKNVTQVAVMSTRQRNELLIMITSNKPEEPERPQIANLKTTLTVSGSREQLALHAVNADLRMVADRLAQQTRIPIILADEVECSITAHLDGLPLDRLLNALANSYALSLSQLNGAYYFGRGLGGKASGYLTTTTRTVPLSYLSPENARALLPDALLPYVQINTTAGAVTVSGSPFILDKIARDLRVLDQPAYHCLLRAWVISCEDQQTALNSIMTKVTGGTTAVSLDSAGSLAVDVGPRQPELLLAQIRALAQGMKMRVEAVPVVQVLNGGYANLFVGQSIYYWRLTDAADQDIVLSSIESGTQLQVTPRTSGEWITVDVKVQNSFLRETNALGPLILRRSVEGTERLRSGDTIIIGGLHLTTSEGRQDKTLAHPAPLGPLARGSSRAISEQSVWVLLQAQAILTPAKPVNLPATEGKR